MANPNPNTSGLKPWEPGKSGNPKGREKGVKNLSTIVHRVLGDEKLLNKAYNRKPEWLASLPDKNLAFAMVMAMAMKAASGDEKAFTALRKAGYGDKLDLSADDQPIQPLYVLPVGGDVPTLDEVLRRDPKPAKKPKAKAGVKKKPLPKSSSTSKPKAPARKVKPNANRVPAKRDKPQTKASPRRSIPRRRPKA